MKPMKSSFGIISAVSKIINGAIARNAWSIEICLGAVGQPALVLMSREYGADGMRESILPGRLAPAIISRLKSMGNLSISEHKKMQMGTYEAKIGRATRTLTIISAPSRYGGENILIDLLSGIKTPIDDLDLEGRAQDARLVRYTKKAGLMPEQARKLRMFFSPYEVPTALRTDEIRQCVRAYHLRQWNMSLSGLTGLPIQFAVRKMTRRGFREGMIALKTEAIFLLKGVPSW